MDSSQLKYYDGSPNRKISNWGLMKINEIFALIMKKGIQKNSLSRIIFREVQKLLQTCISNSATKLLLRWNNIILIWNQIGWRECKKKNTSCIDFFQERDIFGNLGEDV